MFKNLSDQYKGSLLAFIGVMFITPDSLFIRLSDIGTWGLLFYRGAIPFLVVLMGLIIFYKKNFLTHYLKLAMQEFYMLSVFYLQYHIHYFNSKHKCSKYINHGSYGTYAVCYIGSCIFKGAYK